MGARSTVFLNVVSDLFCYMACLAFHLFVTIFLLFGLTFCSIFKRDQRTT